MKKGFAQHKNTGSKSSTPSCWQHRSQSCKVRSLKTCATQTAYFVAPAIWIWQRTDAKPPCFMLHAFQGLDGWFWAGLLDFGPDSLCQCPIFVRTSEPAGSPISMSLSRTSMSEWATHREPERELQSFERSLTYSSSQPASQPASQ